MSAEDKKEETKNTEQPEHHEHVHGADCHHDHDDDDKGAKGEKKIKKALLKLGLNKVDGVNRVTVRQKDNYILYVKDPEVYQSKECDSSYVIFGEIAMEDPDKPAGAHPGVIPEGAPVTTTQDKPVIVEDDDAPVSEEGLEPDNIEMVISETNCSRQKAVKALKKHNGDVVNAILELNN